MSKLKKVLLMCTTYVLVAALAIGGTVAYLQDEDSAVNVMTLGNVYIEQIELQRADGVAYNAGEAGNGNGVKDGALVKFVQNQPLYPAVPKNNAATDYTAEATDLFFWGDYVYSGTAGNGLWNDSKLSNVMDKFVFVKNTGKTEAYFRTLIAFECPEGMEFSEGPDKELMMNINGSETLYEWEEIGYITVDETRYLVMEAIYLNPLAPGNTAHPSLLQVVLTHNATNEDMELLGGTYEILVLSQAVQVAGFKNAGDAFDTVTKTATKSSAAIALDTAFGESEVYAPEWFGGVLAENATDAWDGTADTEWYNDADTEFTLTTAEQLAGLAKLVDEGKTFEGKTVKLGKNLDLTGTVFNPVGSYRNDTAFKGTFDGQGNTISNLSQNTWELDNGYYYGDLGLGLFGLVEDATIKNLVMDGASISGESAICGTVAACAYGECTFENITVKNSKVNDYLYYAGGIVGWASGEHTYKDIYMAASTIVGSQWGDFGNANGGVIGGIGSSAVILMEDCTVACRIDATNDVVSAYQWYNYRNSGMLIGRVPQTITNGEVQTVATPTNVTCKNVTVIYGDWANYHYCEFAGTGYPYVRVEAGVSVDAYSNVRYGHPTDANGNTVVDDDHVHNEGEAHHELIRFDQLFGGPADHRYCYYGISEFNGVTVIYK